MEIMPTMDMVRWAQYGYRWLTVQELAEHLQVTVPQIRRWHRKEKLPARRIGHRIVFLMHEIDMLLPMIREWLARTSQIRTVQGY